MGASPRPLSGEDTTRRRRADTDDRTSIFGTLVGGEPPTPHIWRSIDVRRPSNAGWSTVDGEGFDRSAGKYKIGDLTEAADDGNRIAALTTDGEDSTHQSSFASVSRLSGNCRTGL